MKICVIEDEPDLSETVTRFLSGDGNVIDHASTFAKAQTLIELYQYDCFVVDINLPDGQGTDLLAVIKELQPNAGILILSARRLVDDKVRALYLGADDYLTKPFNLQELNARLHSIMRRRRSDGNLGIVFNEIKIVPEEFLVTVHDHPVALTKTEFDLLLFFVQNKKRVISKDVLLEHLLDDYMNQRESSDLVYAHVKNLRKKMVEAGATDYIKTIYRIGYKFTDQ